MKNYIIMRLIGLALICTVFLGCTSSLASAKTSEETIEDKSPAMTIWEKVDHNEIEIINTLTQGNLEYTVSNLSDLEEHTEYIVTGTFKSDSEQDLQRLSENPDSLIVYGCTITSFEISRVIQGEDLTAGDVIRVGEEYYLDDDGALQISSGYMPSETGREYILFLVKETNPQSRYCNVYASTSSVKGRFPVASPANIAAASGRFLNLEGDVSDTYLSIYEAVVEKYLS